MTRNEKIKLALIGFYACMLDLKKDQEKQREKLIKNFIKMINDAFK